MKLLIYFGNHLIHIVANVTRTKILNGDPNAIAYYLDYDHMHSGMIFLEKGIEVTTKGPYHA